MDQERDSGASFVNHLSAMFDSLLLRAMMERAVRAPDDVRQLTLRIRKKLDAVELVVRSLPRGTDTSGETAHDLGALPTSLPRGSAAPSFRRGTGSTYELGRNLRSRLRELALLETLAREQRSYSLQEILSALERDGFKRGGGAVVSQLHRLKRTQVIEQPGNGLYEITVGGLGHLRKLRSMVGALAESRNVR